MADFLLRDIDERVAERIKELARQRGWPLNDVILHLVKQALGLSEPDPPQSQATSPGSWGPGTTPSPAPSRSHVRLHRLPDDAPSYLLEDGPDRKKKQPEQE
jgi:hypothetical protein